MLHPFLKLYQKQGAEWSHEHSLFLIRRSLATLLPDMAKNRWYIAENPPKYPVSHDLSFIEKSGRFDVSLLLPYHQSVCAGVSSKTCNLQAWAGLDQPLWLIWDEANAIHNTHIPDGLNLATAAQVLDDLAGYSLELIRRDTEHKYIYLTGLLGSKKEVKLDRSEVRTLISFELSHIDQAIKIESQLAASKILLRRVENRLIVANYPVHSKEAYYTLIDKLQEFL